MFPLSVPLPKKKLWNSCKQRYGDRTEDFLVAFAKAYPNYQPKDLVDVDFVFRPSAVEQAKLKAAQQGAPVYMYMFAWESPVLDGMFRSTHCMEIPFAFNNAVLHASMTGRRCRSAGLGREDEQRLAELCPYGQSQCQRVCPSGTLIPKREEPR